MKTPNSEALNALSKAPISDPIIAGTASPSKSVERRTKLTVRLDPKLHGRIRAAFIADLQAGSGLASISAWAAHHLEQAVRDSENRLNNGQPFTAIGTGVVPNFPIA